MKRVRRKTKEEQRLDKFDINKHLKKYKGTTYFRQQRDDGKLVFADRFALLSECHIFMKKYGMGGCKSFSEYVDMVDNEDPVILDTLRALITEDNRCEAGFTPREISIGTEEYMETSQEINVENTNSNINKKDDYDIAHSPVMGFISNFGSTYEETKRLMEEKKEQVGGFSDDRFTDVTSDSITHPDFDLKSVLARMKDAIDRSHNIKITPEMWNKHKSNK